MERTFNHSHKGELHGITVVVETKSKQVFVGRCDTQTEEGIVLLDADVHGEGEEGTSNAEYIQNVVKVGHWNRHAQIDIPSAEITTVSRLGEISPNPKT